MKKAEVLIDSGLSSQCESLPTPMDQSMAQRRSKYKQLVDGEGVALKSGERFKFACCDCGLVHQVVIVARGRDIGFAVKRDKRATAGRRRRASDSAA